MKRLLIVAAILSLTAAPASASKVRAAREAAEYVMKRFGKEAAEEGAEKLAARLEGLAARYGDEVLMAVRKVGPRGLKAVEEAGEHAGLAARLLAREGDRALWVATNPGRLGMVARHGDEAAAALMKHKGLADPLIAAHRGPAAKALAAVDGQNARRLAILSESGELAKIGRSSELLGVVGKFGNAGMDFVWRHKGKLLAAGVLAAFLSDPQPFIEGARDLSTAAMTQVAGPVLETMAGEAARRTNWTVVGVVGLSLSAAYVFWRSRRRQLRMAP